MAVGRIRDEFNVLKVRFNLPNVKLTIGKVSDASATYHHGVIRLPHGRRTRANLFFLLHELCHAAQDKRGVFERSNSFRAHWARELAADFFAAKWYRKLYQRRYGKVRSNVRIALNRPWYKKFYRQDWLETIGKNAEAA